MLDRLELMRLLSAIMAGLTALFVCLFVREALPALPWAWAAGGMAIALTPLLGFMSSGVTPEALLYTVSAAAFLCLARAFRYGLTLRRGAMIGVVSILGMRTKVNFVGLVPGMTFGFVMLVKRLDRDSRVRAYRALIIPVLILGAFAAVAVLSGAIGHSELSSREASVQSIFAHGSLSGRINYIWQLFLPRLPGMSNDFPGVFPSRQIWFNGLVGLYGWLDTTFPQWVYNVALIPAGGLALLSIRGLVVGRSELRERSGEVITYVLMVAGVWTLIGSASYRSFPQIGAAFGQARYLLPLLALMGAGVALAIRGAGSRWGPPIAVAILILFLTHDIFSQLQVIARYYA